MISKIVPEFLYSLCYMVNKFDTVYTHEIYLLDHKLVEEPNIKIFKQ